MHASVIAAYVACAWHTLKYVSWEHVLSLYMRQQKSRSPARLNLSSALQISHRNLTNVIPEDSVLALASFMIKKHI